MSIYVGDKIKLDVELSPELVIDGWFSEMRRNVASMRQKLGLNPEDKISAIYSTFPLFDKERLWKMAKRVAEEHNDKYRNYEKKEEEKAI